MDWRAWIADYTAYLKRHGYASCQDNLNPKYRRAARRQELPILPSSPHQPSDRAEHPQPRDGPHQMCNFGIVL
jgi:hypothetical protein